MANRTMISPSKDNRSFKRIWGNIRKDYLLYAMLIPGLAYFIIFHYWPMYGVSIAFRDYNVYSGFENAKWVGFKYFERLFTLSGFKRAFTNTIIISFLKIVLNFPAPIILSLMINELTGKRYKRFVQTAVILPNFISWVVISGIMYAILSPSTGLIGTIAGLFGRKAMSVMTSRTAFRWVIVFSETWKSAGFGTIVYLAAISGVDPTLYEAAYIDGAGRLRQIWNITIASIAPTIVIMFIFRVGNILSAGFEQIFVLYNPVVYEVSDILDTYVYEVGMVQRNYPLATAAGLFKSLTGLCLVLITNRIARSIDPDSALM